MALCGLSPDLIPQLVSSLQGKKENVVPQKVDREQPRRRKRDKVSVGKSWREKARLGFPIIIMMEASSSPSCFLSCLGHSPGGNPCEDGGSPVVLQASRAQGICRMSESDVAVLAVGPTSLDLFTQERRTLTRLYSQNGGYHLRILPDGSVSGGRQENDPYGEECRFILFFYINQ